MSYVDIDDRTRRDISHSTDAVLLVLREQPRLVTLLCHEKSDARVVFRV